MGRRTVTSTKRAPGAKDAFGDRVTVCLFARRGDQPIAESLQEAAKIATAVLLVCEGGANGWRIPPETRVIAPSQLTDASQKDWFLFAHAGERITLRSGTDRFAILGEKGGENGKAAIGVFVKAFLPTDSLADFQFISNLGQFRKTDALAFTTRVEPRLFRKEFAVQAAGRFLSGTTPLCPNVDGVLHITVEPLSRNGNGEDAPGPMQADDLDAHDLKCLKGEIQYGAQAGEGIDELSSGFNGFRVVRYDYLEGFMESARSGLGIDEMYIPMLSHLAERGHFKEARELFDLWMQTRKGPEIVNLHKIGGAVYANLFELDEAVRHFEKAMALYPEVSSCSALGKIHLLRNDREQAAAYFKKTIEMNPNAVGERYILAVIEREDWNPPTLSVCILARDEEATVAEAIESVKPTADEIVVVDTGSKDRTREIAAARGARVMDVPWEDDFSRARNAGIEGCGGDYILMLDADETIHALDRAGLALFKKLLSLDCKPAFRIRVAADQRNDGLAISLASKLMKHVAVESPVRLFPRDSAIRYARPGFETVEGSLAAQGVPIEGADLFKITHRKDRTAWRNQRKETAILRTYRSLGQGLDQGPGQALNDSQTALDGGLYYLKLGDPRSAVKWFKKVTHGPASLIARIASLCLSQNEAEAAARMIRLARRVSPEDPDLIIAQATVYLREERYGDMIALLKEALRSPVLTEPAQRAEAQFLFGLSLLSAGQVPEGIECLALPLEAKPEELRYRLGGLYALAKTEQWEPFLGAAGEIVQSEQLKIDFVISSFSDIARVATRLLRRFTEKGLWMEARIAQQVLDHIIKTKISSAPEIEAMQACILQCESELRQTKEMI